MVRPIAEDYSQYTDPGVSVQETTGPIVSAVGIQPTVVALIGDSRRSRRHTEVVQLNDTDKVAFKKLGVDTSSVTVRDRYTGALFTVATDYVLSVDSGEDASLGTADDVVSIERTIAGQIPDGTWVTVTYNYTDPDYYEPWRFHSHRDVVDLYGNAFDADGVRTSDLALGAELAFANGASTVICVAVEAAGETPTPAEWQAALDKLIDEPSVNVIVPLTGNTTVHQYVQTFCTTQANLGFFTLGFVGRDGTEGDVSFQDLKNQAAAYSNSRMVVTAPSKIQYYHSTEIGAVSIGGQFIAAALAGNFASRPVQEPLTRKTVRGFYSLRNQPSKIEMTDLQRNGLCVVAQKRSGNIYVRHGLTTDMSNRYTQEISVQAAKDRLQNLIYETLDSQGLIGSVLTELTPSYVIQAITGALETALGAGLISGYDGVEYRIPVATPTLMEVRFQYLPSLPLNYISVQFNLDPTQGTVEFISTNTASEF